MRHLRFAEDFARQQGMDGNLYPADTEDAAIDGVTACSTEKYQRIQPPEPMGDATQPSAKPSSGTDMEKRLMHKLERWVASMERLGLSDYVRYLDNRKRIFWSNFWGGMARGVGMAVGFTILGAILVLILQDLARHNLPLIGDALAQIVSIVQMRLQ